MYLIDTLKKKPFSNLKYESNSNEIKYKHI